MCSFTGFTVFARNPKLNALMADFNQFIRFRYIVLSLRKQLAKKPSQTRNSLKVLDVGAGTGALTNYLLNEFRPNFIVSLETSTVFRLHNLVVADGRFLPFKDRAFDFSVSSDVLEHLPTQDRAMFLGELLRCARYGTVFTFSNLNSRNPHRSGIKLFEFFCKSFPQWYVEHNSNALVDNQRITEVLSEHGATVVDLRPIGSFFAVFFTGTLYIRWTRLFYSFLNIVDYLLIRLIDMPPHYNFGVTALKKVPGDMEK